MGTRGVSVRGSRKRSCDGEGSEQGTGEWVLCVKGAAGRWQRLGRCVPRVRCP